MKHIASIHALIAALFLAAPVAGSGSPGDGDDSHGQHLSSRFHGHFYHRGPRFFYGGGFPLFWGPAIGFSFYGSPGYYYEDGPDRPTYRGTPPSDAGGGDDLGVDVQRDLARQGYYHGPIDGEIGPGSRAAIRAYQSDHGLEVTGRIDNALLRSLHID
jgi:Putative peptidoglycan binding domain